MNLPLILIIAILAFALVLFLIIRNKKDKNRFEKQIDNDYPKPKHVKDENDANEITG